jgi:hypothetical protein
MQACIALSSWSVKLNPIREYVPNPYAPCLILFSAIHWLNNIRPCASTQKDTKVLYVLWITFIVFDFSKSMLLLTVGILLTHQMISHFGFDTHSHSTFT